MEVVQAGHYSEASDEDRITLGRLISLAGQDLVILPEPETADFKHADPSDIENGLYIPYGHPIYASAQQLVRVGINPASRPSLENTGVVFPSSEFQTVARNPRDFARHIEAQTRNANESNPDRDEVNRKVGRSVGHALSTKITSISALDAQIKQDMVTMRSLYRDLNSSWIAHYKVKNLEPKRALADDKIHEVAEISTINLNLGTVAIQGLHLAIKKNLYGGNRTHAEVAYNWQKYIKLVGRHMGAKVHKLEVSEAMCRDEFSRYKYFLEPEARAA